MRSHLASTQSPHFLLQLASDLDRAEQTGRSVFLKVEGSGRERHVAVVKGAIWTLVAEIACFFHANSYDLQEISSVFEEQLTTLDVSSLKDQMPETAIRLADIFIQELSPQAHHQSIANPFFQKQETKQDISQKIQELRNHFIARARAFSSQVSELSERVITEDARNPVEELVAINRALEEAQFLKSRYRKKGSLSRAVLDSIKKGLSDQKKRAKADIATILPTSQLAQVLLEAVGYGDQKEDRKDQAKRAVLCLELKAFLDKAEDELHSLQALSVGSIDQIIKTLRRTLDAAHLDTVSSNELQNLQKLIFDTIGSIQTYDGHRIRKVWPQYRKLEREFTSHIKELSPLPLLFMPFYYRFFLSVF